MTDRWPNLTREVLEVRDYAALKAAKRWTHDPALGEESLYAYETLEDLNDRKRLDALVLAGICANRNLKTILEIGTGQGITTALLAANAPAATVHTVNIPPEEISAGGARVTQAYSRDQIGRYYRDRNLPNVRQIFANTATWNPDLGPIDLAFIDGCHDADFVYHDTRKILPHAHQGTILLWHDFNLDLAPKFEWIAAVCDGVERLYRENLCQGRILHLRDSWVGYYVVMNPM